MCKVLFVHDGPILINDECQYYGLDYNNLVIERYLKLGKSVTFLTRVRNVTETKNFSQITNENFEVIGVPETKSIKNHIKNKKRMSAIVERAVEENDVIVIRLPSVIGMEAHKFAEKAKKKIIVEVVACAFEGYFYHSNLGKVVAPYMYMKTKKIIKKSNYTSYVTTNYLQEKYPNSNNVLACSDVELPEINENDFHERKNKIDSMNDDSKVIFGSIGSIDISYKGHRHAIRAVKRLKEKGYIIEYLIVGNGNKEVLSKLIKKYKLQNEVKLMGPLPHNEIACFLKKLDIYLQPSDVESHGRVILEAFSVGTPVIGSNTGGIPELLDEKYIFKKRDHDDLLKILEGILKVNSKEKLTENVKRNFVFVQNYKLSNLNKMREKFYKSVLVDEVFK